MKTSHVISLSLALVSSSHAGVLFHLNATDDFAGLNDGDPVAAWGALSAIAPNQPTYRATGMNGNASVEFDGVDDFIGSAALNGARSIVAVTTLDTGAPSLAGLASNDNDRLNLRRNNTNAQYRAEAQGGDNNDFYRHGAHFGFDNVYVNGIGSGTLTYDVSHVVISNAGAPADYTNFTIGRGAATGGAVDRWWKGDVSEVYVFDQTLSADEIAGISSILADRWGSTAVTATPIQIAAGNSVLGIIIDTDLDDMDDVWEQAVVDSDPNDNINSIADINPGENLDDDTLTNLQEYLAPQTNPLKGDTDDDGYKDDVETGDGTFDDIATDTGTNPNDPDTDNDGLLDGVETNDDTNDGPTDRGTDPLLVDSDGDGADDKGEIDAGFDPNDENSAPYFVTILGTGTGALLGGDLTDPENDIIDSEPDDGFPLGQNANWVGVTATSELAFSNDAINNDGAHEAALDVFDNKLGGGEAKWCCNGAPQDLTVEFMTPVALTHFTIASSDDSEHRDPTVWAIVGSNDGTTFTPIFERDSATTIWTARNQVARIDLGSTPPAYKFIRYSVSATSSAQHALGEIEYFGSSAPTVPLAITGIDYDETADTFRITWDSEPGKSYALFWSPDLVNWDADVNDSIDSQGDSTTYPSLGNPAEPNPGTTQEDGRPEKIFFRVEENPPAP